jgi:hypothetical protein
MDLRAARLEMSRAEGSMVTMDVAVLRLVASWRERQLPGGAAPLPGVLEAALDPEREPGTPVPGERPAKAPARRGRTATRRIVAEGRAGRAALSAPEASAEPVVPREPGTVDLAPLRRDVREDCPHPKARVFKGLCGNCGQNVGGSR